ncbi:alpha-isopropylmalate synthase regulatory domain-containing protein [Rhodobium orientis]
MIDGKESGGRGVAQDVLEASAKAYLNAVNRYLVLKTNTEGLSKQAAVGS